MVRDMTKGSPWKLILQFSLPLMLGNLFQQLYSMADTIIVGKALGVEALAAVGSTGSLSFLILGFIQGMCCGFTIPVAQYFGAKDKENLQKSVANAVWVAAVLSILLTIVTVAGTKWILTVMQTPQNIFDGAVTYIRILFLGISTIVLYNLLSGFLRALGDSKTPLVFLVISSVLNVALDLLFILVFHMGIAGAAWATVASQAISGILCLLYIAKKFTALHVAREYIPFNREHAIRHLAVGVPMGLQFAITAIGSTVLQSAVNTLGSDSVAAVTAATKVQMLLCVPLETFGLTMATYAGQNLGAGELSRIKTGVRQCLFMGFLFSALSSVIAVGCGTQMALLFLDQAQETILLEVGQFLRYNAVFYCLLSGLLILRNTIQGMGYTVPAMAAGVFEMAARTVVALFFVGSFGFSAVCYANGMAWIAANVLLGPVYIRLMKQLGGL